MEIGVHTMHRRALAALNQMSADEQAQVLESLAALVDTPVAEWPASLARRLPSEPPLYLVRVNDSLRLMVRVIEGRFPKVLDIVQRETLDFFAKAAAKNGA